MSSKHIRNIESPDEYQESSARDNLVLQLFQFQGARRLICDQRISMDKTRAVVSLAIKELQDRYSKEMAQRKQLLNELIELKGKWSGSSQSPCHCVRAWTRQDLGFPDLRFQIDMVFSGSVCCHIQVT